MRILDGLELMYSVCYIKVIIFQAFIISKIIFLMLLIQPDLPKFLVMIAIDIRGPVTYGLTCSTSHGRET